IAFNPQSLHQLDVADFANALQSGNYAQAAALYAGPFLDDFYVADSDLLEDWMVTTRERLHQQMLTALSKLTEQQETQGKLDNALASVRRLLALAPWQEEAHCQLMRLLARSGQRSAALAQYDTLTQMLMDELGVSPAPETDALYDQILAGEIGPLSSGVSRSAASAMAIAPAEPPFQALAQPSHFVGRRAEIERLRTQMSAPGLHIHAIVGMGGVGKTTLATHLAYELRDHFPDGVLWARLDTSDTMSLLTMLAGAYGVDVTRYQTIDSRSAIVRSLLADKRALLILDNAENSNQVAPLLPPTTGSCTVLLTTRHDLAITDGWQQFELRPFTPDSGDALTLFGRFLSSTLVQEQKDCLLEIADLVGHLPLALALIAGQLARHPTAAAVQRFHAALQETNARLSMIQRENRSVRATFELSYQQLSAVQQSFFRQLAIFNGDDFDSQAAAAVTETSLTEAQTQLQQLHKFSLLQESTLGRYRLHPLLRDFALELLVAQQEERPTAERMIAHYLTLVPTAEAPDAAVVT
ncbi:MAG: hypothetical protein KDE47_11970, partial [Caldilineaceae bacterium]|nr:hypothetical protein [Caldilineaceae bacterium]